MSGEMLSTESNGTKYSGLLCPGLLEASESTSMCPLLTPSSSTAHMMCTSPEQTLQDPESVSMCPLLESPPSDMFRHPLDPLAGLAYQQRSGDIDTDSQVFIGLSGDRESRSSSLPGRSDESYSAKRGSVGIAMMESSSSSSSGLQENPAAVQLLNHHYQHLATDNKEAFPTTQENGVVCLELTGPKGGTDYCFVHWNWPVIRTACFWAALSVTVGCFCVVVGMIASVPKKCLPAREWHQGTVFYEIFPASFQDSGHDGVGDIRGVASRTEYLKSLGISAVRLNSIFAATQYPTHFQDVLNLTSIDKTVGNSDDMKYLLSTLHSHNISVILDLPIFPLIRSLKESKALQKTEVPAKKDIADEITNVVHNHRSHRDVFNNSEFEPLEVAQALAAKDSSFSGKSMLAPYIDGGISGLMKVTSQHLKAKSKTVIEEALEYWFSLGIDGVYIKGLEHYVNDPHFLTELSNWNKIKFSHSTEKPKILMADHQVLDEVDTNAKTDVMTTFDLLDVYLEMSNGTQYMADMIRELLASKTFTQREYSWLHWNIGDLSTRRLSERVTNYLGAITFQALLPGTISIFYGDENALSDSRDVHGDFKDLAHIQQLSPMQWVNDNVPFSPVTPWLPQGYAEHVHIIPLIRTITELRQTTPAIFMNKVCKDGDVLLNTGIGFVDDSLIILVRSYPRRFTYAVFYNADVKDITRDLSHIYYGGVNVLDSSNTDLENYIKFKNFQLKAGMAIIIKLDK